MLKIQIFIFKNFLMKLVPVLAFLIYSLVLLELPSAQCQPFACGSMLPPPSLNTTQSDTLNTLCVEAWKHYNTDPKNADALIWYARRLGYLGRYQEAIEVLSKGILLHPEDARMYRHRGHRYLTLRCLDKAIIDFEKAAKLVEGQQDETEPDGQPNEANIPTSTLQSNIFYHLGLAYYLKKNYAKAAEAYDRCLIVSTNPDMFTATANWYYLTLLRWDSKEGAKEVMDMVDFNAPLLENGVYRKLLLLHKEKPFASKALATATGAGDVQSATYLYGLYMYLKLHGFSAEASTVKEKLLGSNQYASFGYIAAEME
jgi:tetratricopeptide (TPR) repeat protein